MTPQEFKAWFGGFTEAFAEKVPTQKQWRRIQERVGEIDGKPVTERVFVDRYLPSYPTYVWPQYIYTQPYRPHWNTVTSYTNNTVSCNAGQCAVGSGGLSNLRLTQSLSYNSMSAMNELGRADAASIS